MVTVVAEVYRAPRSRKEMKLADWLRRAIIARLHRTLSALRLVAQASIDTRAMGYFLTLDRACQAVLRDECGLVMARYDWAVVERIGPGIHAAADATQRWFHYENGSWSASQAPEFARGLVAFAMG